jgi:HEAT repeat protein
MQQTAKPAPPTPPADLREGDIATMVPAALIDLIKAPTATEFQKAKACVRLGELGAPEAVPALATLLADPHLSTYARYGLEPIADPAVDETLRAALTRLKGNHLIGVINSISKRRDTKAVPTLTRFLASPDADLARASASALGHIGDIPSATALRAAYGKTTGPVRLAVADAMLICAEQLLAAAKRTEGMDLYAFLSTPSMPKPVRLAAMNAVIREETSISRPR